MDWIGPGLVAVHTGLTGTANGCNDPWHCIWKRKKKKKRPTRQSSSASAYGCVGIKRTSPTVSWPQKSHSVSFLQLAVTSCSLRNTLTLFLTFNCQNKYHYPSAELAYSHNHGEQRGQHLSWPWRQTVEVLMLKKPDV